jgi:hypothetical protein
MYILLSVLAFFFFALGFFVSKNLLHGSVETTNMSLSSIAGYLRFLSPNKSKTITSIALHNFGLATISYIFSLISGGILGILTICSAFFIGGFVMFTPFTWTNFSFITFELIGMGLAVFGGLYVYEKRKKSNLSLKNIFSFSLIFIFMMFFIYIIAAFIETSLLQKLWG